jgi:serine phosphatase RsbU (regulator of sigma subunit)
MNDAEDPDATLLRRAPPQAGAAETLLHALSITDPEGDIRRVSLPPGAFRIGRVPGNELELPLPDVSRRHAMISISAAGATLEDCGSTNGTWLEGQRLLGTAPLEPGARFTVGSFALHYQRGPEREMRRAAELEAELERAFRYTQALLPAPIEAGPVRAEWSFKPSARIGGDALGYRFLDDRHFAVFMLDVAGHGAGSALLAVSVANLLRDRASPDPAATLAALNQTFQMDSQGGLFFTIWYAVADLTARRLRHAAAGHHPAYLLHGSFAEPQPLVTRNPPIGMMPGVRFRSAEAVLPVDSRLVLFSDGAFEFMTPDGVQRGLPDFLALLDGPPMPGPGTADRLLRAVREAARPGPLDDDASILSLDFP